MKIMVFPSSPILVSLEKKPSFCDAEAVAVTRDSSGILFAEQEPIQVLCELFILGKIQKLKDSAYFCYCAYILRISRYSGFLWEVPSNTGIFLRGLKLCGVLKQNLPSALRIQKEN